MAQTGVSCRDACAFCQCSSEKNPAKERTSEGPFMSHDRLVPLIIAVALFMENMDSTIIATSLPAIAADLGANPAGAQTRGDLLPALPRRVHSGERVDRRPLRRTHRVPRRHRHFRHRFDRLCTLRLAHRGSWIARIVQGISGTMMTPVGRLVLVRSIATHQLVDAIAWVRSRPHRADRRPAGRWLHHHLCGLALDLHHQRADRTDRDRARHALHRGCAHRGAGALRPPRDGTGWRRRRRPRLRALGCGAGLDPPALVMGLIAAGAIFMAAYVLHARGTPTPVLDFSLVRLPTFRANVVSGSLFRMGIGALAFPAAADAPDRLQLHPASIRADHLHGRGRRLHDEGVRRTHHPPFSASAAC